MQGNSREERLEQWYCHFQNLLGEEVTDTDKVGISVVHNNFDIEFSFEELELKNKSTEEVKSSVL